MIRRFTVDAKYRFECCSDGVGSTL